MVGLLFLELLTQAEATLANLIIALVSEGFASLRSNSSLSLISLIKGNAHLTSNPSSALLPVKSSNKTTPNP
ncbi:hypothetical protein BDE02_04G042300 [Populus trichocarpa]|nr:hypothetical protein BDE02_04G042300 [Populus trichocarpa]